MIYDCGNIHIAFIVDVNIRGELGAYPASLVIIPMVILCILNLLTLLQTQLIGMSSNRSPLSFT